MYRQKRVLGVLALLQSVALVGIGARLLTGIDWDRIVTLADEQTRTIPQPLKQ